MNKTLNKDLLVQIIREEWNKKYNGFIKEAKEKKSVRLSPDDPGDPMDVYSMLDVDTKITNDNGVEYTVKQKGRLSDTGEEEKGLYVYMATPEIKYDASGKPVMNLTWIPESELTKYYIGQPGTEPEKPKKKK